MTKRKAIEAACDVPDEQVHALCPEGTWGKWIGTRNKIIAERAYNYGRIAGLREAAKIVCHLDGWVPGGSLPTIRKRAYMLAKKARTK